MDTLAEDTDTSKNPHEYKYESKKYLLKVTFPDPETISGSEFNLYRKAMEQTSMNDGKIRLMFYTGIRTCMSWKVPFVIIAKEIRNGEEHNEALSLKHLLAWESKPDQENFHLVAWFAKTFDAYITLVVSPNV